MRSRSLKRRVLVIVIVIVAVAEMVIEPRQYPLRENGVVAVVVIVSD